MILKSCGLIRIRILINNYMHEGFPQTSKPKAAQEHIPAKPIYVPTLEDMLSKTPVQGLGYERFTDSERTDIDALLSTAGSNFDDPLLQSLRGETLLDLMKYARSASGTPERAQAAAAVKSAIEETRTEYYKEAT